MLGIGHLFVKIPPLFPFSQTGWAYRDRMGISLFDLCMFDVRDTLVYESHLEDFKDGEFIGETGPSQKAAMDEKRGLILEAAGRFRQDIFHFGAFQI